MEPKYLTLIQAAAISIILSVVVITHEPPAKGTDAQLELAAQR